MCPCFVHSPDSIFKVVFIVAWAHSRTPMVCACFVAVCFKSMPNISVSSCITWEMKMLPFLSVIKEACLVIMSITTFAVLTAVGLETGYANAYLENTSIAVMIFS